MSASKKQQQEDEKRLKKIEKEESKKEEKELAREKRKNYKFWLWGFDRIQVAIWYFVCWLYFIVVIGGSLILIYMKILGANKPANSSQKDVKKEMKKENNAGFAMGKTRERNWYQIEEIWKKYVEYMGYVMAAGHLLQIVIYLVYQIAGALPLIGGMIQAILRKIPPWKAQFKYGYFDFYFEFWMYFFTARYKKAWECLKRMYKIIYIDGNQKYIKVSKGPQRELNEKERAQEIRREQAEEEKRRKQEDDMSQEERDEINNIDYDEIEGDTGLNPNDMKNDMNMMTNKIQALSGKQINPLMVLENYQSCLRKKLPSSPMNMNDAEQQEYALKVQTYRIVCQQQAILTTSIAIMEDL